MENEIDRDLERADQPGQMTTRPEQRGAFTRPIDRPQAGETILARLATRFSPRSEARDTGRDSSRR